MCYESISFVFMVEGARGRGGGGLIMIKHAKVTENWSRILTTCYVGTERYARFSLASLGFPWVTLAAIIVITRTWVRLTDCQGFVGHPG